MNEIVVRPAGFADCERMALVAGATFLETFTGVIDGHALLEHCRAQHSVSAYDRLLRDGARGWLAELDGAPVGYALSVEPDLEAARPGDVELKRIYLLSRFHGGGAARDLLHAALADAGQRRLLLGVKADNARAIAFYEKHGFSQVGTRQFDVGGRLYDDVVLARSPESIPT